MFNKSIEDINCEDLEQVVERSVAESDTVEFKENLPAEQGIDRWHSDQSGGIGNYARDKILSEIIAFANTAGGTLAIGIEESDEAPPTAVSLKPIPRCTDLALRLEQQAGNCIEPQIAGLRVRGIPTDSDGNGIVVANTARSNLSPHRLKQTRHCYIRRGERTEKMSMREIRDLVLATRDLSGFIDKRFDGANAIFRSEFAIKASSSEHVRAVEITAVPLDPDRVSFDAIEQTNEITSLSQVHGAYTQEDGTEIVVQGQFPASYLRWRPILRGFAAESERSDQEIQFRMEVHNDGDIRLRLFMTDDMSAGKLYIGWLVGLMANVFQRIAIIRNTIHEPALEYGISAMILAKSQDPIRVGQWSAVNNIRFYDDVIGAFQDSEIDFPGYRVTAELSDLLNLFTRDIKNSIGHKASADSQADWRFS